MGRELPSLAQPNRDDAKSAAAAADGSDKQRSPSASTTADAAAPHRPAASSDGGQTVNGVNASKDHVDRVDPADEEEDDDGGLKDGILLAEPNSTKLSDVLIVFFYHMLPFTPVPLFLTALTLWWLYSSYGWFGISAYVAFLVFTLLLPPFYDRKFRDKLQFLYVAAARYMKEVRVIIPKNKLPKGPYIFGLHPHGRMFYCSTMLFNTNRIWKTPFLPDGDFLGAAAAGFFFVPILRNFFYMIGVMPASKENIVKTLRRKDHVTIVVGGVKEVCLGTSPHVDTLYLLKRKGFAKIALQEKVGVIPVYCFNENQLYKHDPKWLLKFWERVNRFVNVGVPFMRGVCHLPMPFRRKLLIVIGDPVFPKEGESLDDFHARYVEALKSLFDSYVSASPTPKQKLVIT